MIFKRVYGKRFGGIVCLLAAHNLRVAIVRFELFCKTVAHRLVLESRIVCVLFVYLTQNYHTPFAHYHT